MPSLKQQQTSTTVVIPANPIRGAPSSVTLKPIGLLRVLAAQPGEILWLKTLMMLSTSGQKHAIEKSVRKKQMKKRVGKTVR